MIDERITSLKAELPNSEDAQAARNQSIANYEQLKTRLEALRDAALEFSSGDAKEETVVEASTSLAQGIAAWWTQCHVQICERVFDMGLFTLGVSVCSLAGSGGALAAAVSGVLVKGKPVADTIKALFRKK